MNTAELINLWANDAKRREFVNSYKSWGEWFKVPQLDLTFYKYELPDGSKIIVMEYLQKNYYVHDGEPEYHTGHVFFLQKYEHFMPEHVSDSLIAGHLMTLKQQYQDEQKKARQCANTNEQEQ